MRTLHQNPGVGSVSYYITSLPTVVSTLMKARPAVALPVELLMRGEPDAGFSPNDTGFSSVNGPYSTFEGSLSLGRVSQVWHAFLAPALQSLSLLWFSVSSSGFRGEGVRFDLRSELLCPQGPL